MPETMLDAALDYAKRGLAVFPLAEGTKIPCIQGGFTQATTDEEQIRLFWSTRPRCNIGIATGGMSNGLVVIDVDLDNDKGEDGYVTLNGWESEHGELPEGACATTPRGGMHLYFVSDEPYSSSVNKDLGIDVRADGGFVVAPPSVREDGRQYEWDLHIEDYGIPRADENVKAFLDKVQDGKLNSEKKFVLPDRIRDGERNDTLYRYACSLQAHSVPDEVIVASVIGVNKSLCDSPVSDSECEKIVNSALSKRKGLSDEAIALKRSVYRMLDCNDKGAPYQTITNCMTVLANDPLLVGRFGYNLVAYTKTIETPVPWDTTQGTRQITDVDYSQFAAYLEKEYGLHSKQKAIDAITNICSQNRYNPIAEWLETLKWDGTPRTRGLLPLFLGATESDYNTEVIELFMRGAIARALKPGTKFDHMIVLVGKQGIGKSTFLRRLAHTSAWFNDNFNTIEGDNAVEKLRGMWMVEMAELLSVKKAKEVEAVKSFVTSTVDTIRPKYARETEQRPRVCVFAGTTNDMDFLSDPTGNRRFIPIHCDAQERQEILFDDSSQEFFDQCWAEVYSKWKAGEQSLVLPRSIEKIADAMRESHTEDDPRVALIQQHLDAKMQNCDDPESVSTRVCVTEILKEVLDAPDYRNPPRRLVNEIHAIMRNSVEGYMPYSKAGGKANTAYGMQRCYVIDPKSPRYAVLRQIISGTADSTAE